jgi:hypothetical protein
VNVRRPAVAPVLLGSLLACSAIAAPRAAGALPPPPFAQQWASPASHPILLSTLWGDGTERALVDAGAGIRVLNLKTGVLEGSIPARYGLLAGMTNGYTLIDPNSDGQLRLVLAGRVSAGAPWYIGVFALAAPGHFTLSWETSPETVRGFRATRVLGAGDDVIALRQSGSGDNSITLHDGGTGTVLWEQQVNGIPPMVTLVDSDVTGDGIADWLMEVRTSLGSPIELRLLGLADGVVAAPAGPLGGSALALGASVPNPFVGDARIAYTLGQRADALVRIFDTAGRHVRTLARGVHEAGPHAVTWDGRDDAGRAMPGGVYLYEVRSGGESLARRMIRIR